MPQNPRQASERGRRESDRFAQELTHSKQLLRNGARELAIESRVSGIGVVVSSLVAEYADVRGWKHSLRVSCEEEETRLCEHALACGSLHCAELVQKVFVRAINAGDI